MNEENIYDFLWKHNKEAILYLEQIIINIVLNIIINYLKIKNEEK